MIVPLRFSLCLFVDVSKSSIKVFLCQRIEWDVDQGQVHWATAWDTPAATVTIGIRGRSPLYIYAGLLTTSTAPSCRVRTYTLEFLLSLCHISP